MVTRIKNLSNRRLMLAQCFFVLLVIAFSSPEPTSYGWTAIGTGYIVSTLFFIEWVRRYKIKKRLKDE